MLRTSCTNPLVTLALVAALVPAGGCITDDLAGGPAPGDGGAHLGPDGGGDDDGSPDAAPGAPVTYDVHLRTEVGGQYLSAINAGGGAVNATGATAREWELFHLTDENGGALESGDLVHVVAYDNASYLRAGADGTVDATGTAAGTEERFAIERISGAGAGAAIASGDTVALRAQASQKYVTAADGGGGAVAAGADTAGAWEHFVIDGLPGDMPPPPPTGGKRVIGYLPNWYGSYADWAGKVDFSRVTQVNLAFALGTDGGYLGLAPDDQIGAFVTAAHAHGVKVFVSLCGGGGDGTIAPHYQAGEVDAFVDHILQYVDDHALDGIDVDVEAPGRMGAAYDGFIGKLKAKASLRGWPVTAAVAQWVQDGMSNETLRSFDFITVMSYDNAGTWTGPGEHASMGQARDAIDFYKQRGVDPERIVLGVPFYGYCWGNCNGQGSAYVLYKDIVGRFPDAWNQDWIQQDGATYSWNGVATMKEKVQLGNQYGGIMIWELGGDFATTNPKSLLRAISEAQ